MTKEEVHGRSDTKVDGIRKRDSLKGATSVWNAFSHRNINPLLTSHYESVS